MDRLIINIVLKDCGRFEATQLQRGIFNPGRLKRITSCYFMALSAEEETQSQKSNNYTVYDRFIGL